MGRPICPQGIMKVGNNLPVKRYKLELMMFSFCWVISGLFLRGILKVSFRECKL